MQPNETITRAKGCEVFIDATNAIQAAAKFCEVALHHDMHLVMMNAEFDLQY